jgi:hypothetical protein
VREPDERSEFAFRGSAAGIVRIDSLAFFTWEQWTPQGRWCFMQLGIRVLSVPIVVALLAAPSSAGSFFFSTGDPDGKMATASRPSSAGKIEIESADDFVLTSPTKLTSATLTGLLPTGAPLSDVVDVRIEIYRVFPNDSDVNRTSGPPTFRRTGYPRGSTRPPMSN